MKSLRLIYSLLVLFTINTSIAQQGGSLEQMRKEQQQQVQEQNRQTMQQFGSIPPPTQAEIAGGHYYDALAVKKEQKQRELFSEINALNNPKINTSDRKISKEVDELKLKLRLADTNSVNYKSYKKFYQKSYNELFQMLSGKAPLNLKRAVFLTENPFHKNTLSYEKYCKQIDSLTFICKQIISQNGLNDKNYMASHYAIQKLFSEKGTYKNNLGKEVTFEPLTYDLSIYDSTKDGKDWTEQFVSKLLNIKKGQCHSMPLLYLILAEELNTNAYLALAPNHSYIKFGNQRESFCFETTNGTLTSDEWVVSSGFISSAAIKNQIYLAPLTKKQVIAECLNDLESGLEFLCGKSDFSTQCANTALEYYPKSIRAILIINNTVIAECAKIAGKYHFPKYSDYDKYPELKKRFDEMLNLELQVENTGYQKVPDEAYEKWRQSANAEKERRKTMQYSEMLQKNANEK